MTAERVCRECGGSLAGRKRNVVFCDRTCQVAAYQRSRRSRSIRIRLTEEALEVIDREAEAAVISPRRYAELVVEAHVARIRIAQPAMERT